QPAPALHFLRPPPLGVLFRHPQGRCLLRCAQDAAKARGAHGDGRAVLLPHRLAPPPPPLPPPGRLAPPAPPPAPITCFTAEEAWLARAPDVPDGAAESVHLRVYPEIPAAWLDAALGEKWKMVRALRRVVTGALELERGEKRIGSSLQAAPRIHAAAEYLKAFEGLDLCEIFITSDAELLEGEAPPRGAFSLPDVAGVAVEPLPAQGNKCA